MPGRVESQCEHRRPVEEQAVESCAVTTLKRRCESWSDCALSVGQRVRAHLCFQGHLDQVQELLLRGLM